MRPFFPILVLSLLTLLPSLVSAEPLTFSVGKRSTWIDLETGDRRILGRRTGEVEIDLATVREKCAEAVEDFEGIVRLRPKRLATGLRVRVECLRRVEPTSRPDPAA